MLFLVLLTQIAAVKADLEDCPMQAIRSVILEVQKESRNPEVQKRVIRRIASEVYGGDWGVVIIRDPALATREVSWEFPFQNNADGTPGFCLTVIKGWLYHVIKVCGYGQSDKVNVEGLVNKLRGQVTRQSQLDLPYATTKVNRPKKRCKNCCKKCRNAKRS